MRHEIEKQEDVEAILRIAVSKPVHSEAANAEDLRTQLSKAAEELGVSQEELDVAEAKWRQQREDGELGEFTKAQRRLFNFNLGGMLVTSALAVLLSVLYSPDNALFASIIFFVWGFFVLRHRTQIQDTQSESFQKRFEEWRANR